MKVLVINTGSSSIKYKLFGMEDTSLLAAGMVENIGGKSVVKHSSYNGKEIVFNEQIHITNHKTGLEFISHLMIDDTYGVIGNPNDITAVGHRVVHGGEAFHEPVIIDNDVMKAIEQHIPLAPLHNPANLTGIKVAKNVFPRAVQVAVFDTAFHQTIPDYAYTYAIPYDLYQENKIRKYGFHGTSHKYITHTIAAHLDIPLEKLNIISIHLGNGSSIAAVENGKCIDTTMGMTPMAGLMMGTRCGDLDPAVIFHLVKNNNLSCEDIDVILNKKSGFMGIAQHNDLREVIKQRDKGCDRSRLAIDMLAYQIKKYIGSYYAALGRIDCIVFTAGIGENSALIRSLCLNNLENMGVCLDSKKNNIYSTGIKFISQKESSVRVAVVPTNEELQIALETSDILGHIIKKLIGSKTG